LAKIFVLEIRYFFLKTKIKTFLCRGLIKMALGKDFTFFKKIVFKIEKVI